MIPIHVDYASPSVFDSDRSRALLGLSGNTRRPVRFHGRILRGNFVLRFALRALGEIVWSDDTWPSASDILDPVITIHPDRVFFEAFSQDQSVYACVIVDPALFDIEGEVVTGTTNIDFSVWLWGALGEMRSSRDTFLRVGAEGFEVRTVSAGGRFERQVKLSDEWVRGFLQIQAAMAMPGTRLSLRPIDLLAALRFLRYTRARVSPRLRYEMDPDQDARLVLEPWEHVVPLQGAEHGYTEPRIVRTWGRRRLKLIEGLLPFAERVDVYLKGRALPSFYAVKLPGVTFLLGLSGWSAQGWTGSGSFDLLAPVAGADDAAVQRGLDFLRERTPVALDEFAGHLAVERGVASAVLMRLCRQGRCIYDVEDRRYRHRELFEEPPDEAVLFPPNRRVESAQEFLQAGRVTIERCEAEENTKVRRLKTPEGPETRRIVYRDWRVIGRVADAGPTEIVINDTGRMIFGKCTCPFFEDNLMNQGPCAHMLALQQASADQRADRASSTPASETDLDAPRVRPTRAEIEEDDDES